MTTLIQMVWGEGKLAPAIACGLALGILGLALPAAAATWATEGGGTEISVSGGYQFGGSFEDDGAELELEPAANFGLCGSFARPDQPALHGEGAYSRQRTRVNLRRSDIEEPEYIFDVDMHYILLGAVYDFPQSRQVIPFAGLYLGAAVANPVGDQYDAETFFAFAPVGGLKAYFTPTFGLRAQTRLLAPISLESGSIFCTNGACAVAISAGSVLWQGDVSIGALFHFF